MTNDAYRLSSSSSSNPCQFPGLGLLRPSSIPTMLPRIMFELVPFGGFLHIKLILCSCMGTITLDNLRLCMRVKLRQHVVGGESCRFRSCLSRLVPFSVQLLDSIHFLIHALDYTIHCYHCNSTQGAQIMWRDLSH